MIPMHFNLHSFIAFISSPIYKGWERNESIKIHRIFVSFPKPPLGGGKECGKVLHISFNKRGHHEKIY